MRRTVWIRRLALGAAALLGLFAVAAAVVLATFDAERTKALAVEAVRDRYQRTLAIDGPVTLSVFPRLAVDVSQVRLSERASRAEFAAVEGVSLALQWLPLLGRRVVVDRLALQGVRAVYERRADGRTNLDDLLGPPAPAATAAAPAGGSAPPFALDLGAITVDDLRLTVRDAVAKRAGQLEVQRFESGRLARGVATPLKLRARIVQTQPQALQLAVEASGRVALDFANGALDGRDLKLAAEGDAAGLQGLVLQVAAKSLARDPAARRLQFEALAVSLRGRAASQPLQAQLDWPRLEVVGERLSGSGLSGRLQREGAAPLSVSFRSDAPSGSFEAVRLPGLALTFEGRSGERKVDGRARGDLLLQPGRGAFALERLDGSANVAAPGAAPLAAVLRGQLGGDAKAVQWTLDGALAANRFVSQGSVALGAATPRVRATARFDSLDLNTFLGSTPPATQPAAAADERISFDGLRSVDGQFTLTAGALAFRQYRLTDARLEAALDAGVLRVSRLAARAWSGSLEGSGSADAKSQRLAVKLVATGVDVDALLQTVAGKDLLEGRGRVQADLATQGATIGALRSQLAGTAALQVRDGAVKGINLARTMRQARAALTGREDALTRARATEKTDFSELSLSARIADGVARSDDLDLKSPFLRIGGAGTFDIGRGRIDYTARATVVAAAAGQDAGDLAALRGVTVPVVLSGPFDAIDWRIQWSGVAAAAVENKLKDKLAEKLGAKLGLTPAPAGGASAPAAATPKDPLKERLKGLFQ